MQDEDSERLFFVGKILDNVHGFIWYTKAEERIIKTLLFKRLQSIKQLSLVNWIFPGSEHTRFIHSLGVMHIADRMALALSLPCDQRRIVRLAGLLHDIGHYPLSHVGEFPYKKKTSRLVDSDFIQQCNDDTISKIESYKFNIETEFMKSSKYGHHEEIGALIIQNSTEICQIIRDECGENAVGTICDMITGNIRDETKNELLVQILHSELDADGIDYLLRDAMFSGTSFGHFELDQLISNLRCCNMDGKMILCIDPKGIAAADQYLINKFFSFSQVIFNKHTTILEWMAVQIVAWMQENSAYFPSREDLRQKWTIESGYDHFLLFTDDFFWHSLRDILKNPARATFPSYIIKLCTALLNHQECSYIENSEIKIITASEAEFRQSLVNHNFSESMKKDQIVLFAERNITKHVPAEKFHENLKDPDDVDGAEQDKGDASKFKQRLAANRLLEGICVVDKDDVHLLCDDNRSLIHNLFGLRLLVIRRYQMIQ